MSGLASKVKPVSELEMLRFSLGLTRTYGIIIRVRLDPGDGGQAGSR